jgi:ribosomal protein S18 acetylase RimI-like enzyme
MLTITDARHDDLESVTGIHLSSFPNFFLTQLGEKFVREYYRIVLRYPNAIFLVARKQFDTVGFITGFKNPKLFYGFYKSHFFKLAFLAFISISKKPSLVLPVLRKVHSLYTNRIDMTITYDDIEISSIAVHPRWQKGGIGSALMKRFISISCQMNASSVYLLTDKHNNVDTNNFYIKHGMTCDAFLKVSSRNMNVYRLNLKRI